MQLPLPIDQNLSKVENEIDKFVSNLKIRKSYTKKKYYDGKKYKQKFKKRPNVVKKRFLDDETKYLDYTLNTKDLNTATSLDLDSVLYIPISIKQRILKYRNILGGFYSFDQLLSVYGMQIYHIEKFKLAFYIDTNNIKRSNLNFIDKYQLMKNPIINKNIAESIIYERTNNGAFIKVSDLKKCVNDTIYNKIKYYFVVR